MAKSECIYKRPHEDSDEESLLSRCFQIGPEVELKDVPTNGEEYLLKVMQERKNVAAITKCRRDYSKFSINQSCFVEEETREPAHEKMKPTVEWQNIQVEDFTEVSMYVSKWKNKNLKNIEEVIMKPETRENWQQFFNSREPTLTCMLGLNSQLLHNGLKLLSMTLSKVKPGESIDSKTGRWIYAFMVCLRQPLLSDTISVLRNIARKCAIIRSHVKYDEDALTKIAPLNMFICLISRYFRQLDLADS